MTHILLKLIQFVTLEKVRIYILFFKVIIRLL
jgi:hypothetical protein